MSSSVSTSAAAVSIVPQTAALLCSEELRPLHLSFGCPIIDKLLSPATSAPLQEAGADGAPVLLKSVVEKDGFTPARPRAPPVLGAPQGLPLQGLIELVGEASSGKTQYALTAVVRTVLPTSVGGLGGRALYINTEGHFPTPRLHGIATELAAALTRLHTRPLPASGGKCMHADCCCKRADVQAVTADYIMDRIHIAEAVDLDGLNDILIRLPYMVKSKDIKLIVLDSIAAIHRGEAYGLTGSTDYVARAKGLFHCAALLKALNAKFRTGIMVVNQVTDVLEDAARPGAVPKPSVHSDGRRVRPSMGLTWEQCVDTRIFFAVPDVRSVAPSLPLPCFTCPAEGLRVHVPLDNVGEGPPAGIRRIHLDRSTYAPPGMVRICLTPFGVAGTPT